MTGLKSGSGDDLWGDDTDSTDEDTEQDARLESSEQTINDERSAERSSASEQTNRSSSGGESSASTDTATTASGASEHSSETQAEQSHSYIIRRAIQDKSVQFERDERLTFFVHDDVVEGERDLITELESTLGRDVPKFDVREAVYRAALRNRDDVLEELLSMGYSREE